MAKVVWLLFIGLLLSTNCALSDLYESDATTQAITTLPDYAADTVDVISKSTDSETVNIATATSSTVDRVGEEEDVLAGDGVEEDEVSEGTLNSTIAGDRNRGGRRHHKKCGYRVTLPSAIAHDAMSEDRDWSSSALDEFGDTDILNRIVQGRVTVVLESPWQVSIHRGGRHICGGAIIGKRHILSAAHCFKERDRRHYKIYVGKSLKGLHEPGEQGPYFIEAVIIHGHYGKINRHDSDIAIVKMTRPFTFSDKVTPICLPTHQDTNIEAGTRCFLSGYGRTQGTGGDDNLKIARVSLLANDKCAETSAEWGRGLITENMLCAGTMIGDDGASCKGDSGGPLFCETHKGSNVFALQGLVSFGKSDCGDPRTTPGVYTRVAHFFNWIKKNYQRLNNYHIPEVELEALEHVQIEENQFGDEE